MGDGNLTREKMVKGSRFTQAISFLALLLVLVLAVFAMSCQQKEEIGDRIGVVASILPLADFVENVGGEKVDVSVMVPSGASPHVYEPTPSRMAVLAGARMYARVGSGIEFELVWVDKLIAINPGMLVVNCSKGIEIREMAGEHEHGAMDPHIWMSPLNVKIMVQNIYEGLVQVDPNNKTYYEKNRDTYLRELTKLDQDIRDGLSRVTNRKFMTYHPAFGYFAREYNLTMLPIEAEGKEPTAAGLAHLIEQAKEHDIRVIFASPQFNPQSAEVIAKAIGGRVVFIDSLAKDYIMNMRLLLGELIKAMK